MTFGNAVGQFLQGHLTLLRQALFEFNHDDAVRLENARQPLLLRVVAVEAGEGQQARQTARIDRARGQAIELPIFTPRARLAGRHADVPGHHQRIGLGRGVGHADTIEQRFFRRPGATGFDGAIPENTFLHEAQRQAWRG